MLVFEIICFIFFGFVIFMDINTYVKNQNSTIISMGAQLINKKRDIHAHIDANGVITTNETLILVFRLDTGKEARFTVEGRVFKSIPEYECGILTFQGTHFLKFQSPSGVVESFLLQKTS